MKSTKFTTKRSRISQFDPGDPPPLTGALFPRGFLGVQSSKPRSNCTAIEQNQEATCTKRVRFAAINEDIHQEVPSGPVERKADKNSADPKTSEYAFFKKLKESAGHRVNTHTQAKSQSKKLKLSDFFEEKSTVIKNWHKDLSSSSLALNVTSDNSLSFIQRDCIPKNPAEVDIQRAGTVLGDMQVEGSINSSRHGGNQHKHALIFSEKRQKLRRRVAETSLPEIDELCSKGYDFVSLLLNRLLPESDKDKSLNCFKTGQSQTEIDFKCNPDIPVKKLHRIPAKNFMDTEFWSPEDSCLPTYLLKFPSDKELPNSTNATSHSHVTYFDNRIRELGCKVRERATPISCAESDSTFGSYAERHKSFMWTSVNELDEVRYPDECSHGRESQKFLLGWDFDNRIHELGSKVHERATPISSSESDSTFGSYAKRHKSFALTCLNELDEVWYPDEYSHGRESHKFLLGWDFDRMADEEKPSITPENTELAIYPISCGVEEQMNLDYRVNIRDLCEPYLLGHRDWNPTSVHCTPSGGGYNFSGHSLEIKDDTFDVLNGFSLPMSKTENHLNLAEYSYSETTNKGSRFLLSPPNHGWFMSKVLTEEHHFPATEALFSSGPDHNQGRKFLAANDSSRDNYSTTYHALEFPLREGLYSPTGEEYGNFPDYSSEGRVISHFHRGMFNIHDWPWYYFQVSTDKEKAYPLLLDNSHGNEPERETYSDSGDMQYF